MSLILHAGAHEVSLDEIAAVETPDPIDRWHPLPHIEFLENTENALLNSGLSVVSNQHALWGERGQRYFGLLELKADQGDYATVVGLRNSHDKKFTAQWACGSRVFVCDNLAFSGEIMVGRKHTTNIRADLHRMTLEAVGKLNTLRVNQEVRIETYKDTYITGMHADHLIMEMYRSKVINIQRVPKVLKEWEEPSYDDFQPRNAWSLLNAVTTTLAGQVMTNLTATPALHGLLDNFCGVKLAEAA